MASEPTFGQAIGVMGLALLAKFALALQIDRVASVWLDATVQRSLEFILVHLIEQK